MYRAILRTPGILPLLLTSIVGRLPMGAIALVLLLRTREMTGSYAAGGLVAAVNALAHAFGAPVLGRLVDRRGQTGVIVGSAIVWTAGMTAFALLPDGAPLAAALACSAACGLTFPPLIACQRAIWSDELAPDTRHTAFNLESVVFELVYIAGPLVMVGVIGAWSLQASAAAVALAGFTGSLAFAAHPLSRGWHPNASPSRDLWGALRGAGVRTILITLALFGLGVAGVEIAVAAFAEEQGNANSVGVLLALWGVGSMVGGLIAGHFKAPADPPRRLALLLALLALSNLPMALASDLVGMGALITISGLAIAPSLALAFGLLAEAAPAGTVTEAQAWVGTAFGGGIAAGSALGGWVVETAGPATEFVVVAAGVLAAAAVVSARLRTLPARPLPQPAPA